MPRRYSRMGIGGDGSTLNLDFTKMSALDSRFTFTRSTTATYINSSGYVASAAINEARFECDATTLAAKGLLIEGSATNLLLQSESLATSPWSAQNGATVANVSLTNPANGATSTQITTGGAGSNLVGQTPTYGAAGAHTLSIWVRSGTATRISIGIYSGGFVTGTISVLSGSATVTGTDLFTVTNLTSTWTKLQIVYTTLSAGAVLIYPDTPSPTVGLTVYAWGAQLETGKGASSYIPTTTAQVTKAADFCKMTEAASQMAWLQKIDTCTFFVDFTPLTQRGAFNSLVRLSTTTSQGHEFYVYDTVVGVSLTTVTKITASTNQEQTLAQSMALNSRHKVAYSIDATNGFRSHNGSTISAANPIALPTGTRSTFGILSSGFDSGAMSGWIRAFKYYPTALTQAQINGLTT